MESSTKILFLLFLSSNFKFNSANDGLLSVFEDKFQLKLSEYTNDAAKWLEDFNDKHLGHSEVGKMLRYDILKPKFGVTVRDSSLTESRGMKRMTMALIPLIFHIGATSTWMMLTSIMTVKSVAIGMALLIFKIAVGSAKVASFFTTLKHHKYSHGHSYGHGHHHDHSWAPHYEHHHGHKRSLSDIGSSLPSGSYSPSLPSSYSASPPSSSYSASPPSDWNSYAPEVHDVSPPVYNNVPSIPTYKNHDDNFVEAEYSAETKKSPVVHS